MSLATRCNRCGTIFRVVQDQLKISEGWVRCGRCQEVFNALEGLFDLERDATPQRPAGQASATQTVVRAVEDFIASQQPSLDEELRLPARLEADPTPAARLPAPFGPAAAAEDNDDGDDVFDRKHPDFVDARFPSELPLDAADEDAAAATGAQDDAAALPTAEPVLPSPAPSLRQRWRERRAQREQEAISSLFASSLGSTGSGMGPIAAPTTAMLQELPPGVAPDFVRKAEDAARWQRPRVRASLYVAALLLAGMLSVQLALQFRDSLAARRPDLRVALETLCELFDCRLEAPRRLAALTVEASGLTQVEGGDAYRLSLSLNNHDSIGLAAPAVELSITDSSGGLIARRALLPGDFHNAADGKAVGAAAALPPGSEAQWQALLAVDGARVSGYTLELFYP